MILAPVVLDYVKREAAAVEVREPGDISQPAPAPRLLNPEQRRADPPAA